MFAFLLRSALHALLCCAQSCQIATDATRQVIEIKDSKIKSKGCTHNAEAVSWSLTLATKSIGPVASRRRPVAVKVAVPGDIASLGTWEDRDRLLLVVKRGRIRFGVLLCEVMLLGHVEVRDHLPPIEGRPVSL